MRLATASLLVVSLWLGCSDDSPAPDVPPSTSSKTSGGRTLIRPTGFSGVGWSVAPRTEDATRQALAEAERGNPGSSELTFVYYTPQHDPSRISAVLRGTDKTRRLIGMSSHDGLLTSEGYHTSPAGVVGVLVVRADGMSAGVGSAHFADVAKGQEGEAGRVAYRRAVVDAKRTLDEKPAMVILLPTLRSEEKLLAAITDEVGPNVPVIGGTAAGPSKDIALERLKEGLEWSIVVNDGIVTSGVAVAVLYAPKPFGWAYGGGFQRSTTKTGVITNAEPRMIRTIDGRPALDVYDEWVGGGLKEAMKRGENMLVWCALHPLTRNVYGSDKGEPVVKTQFLHPHPNPDQKTEPGSLLVGANVTVGEVLNLGEGSWNILLNRFAQLPRQAKTVAENIDPIAGLFFYCGGALETIPRDHRGSMGYLVSQSMGHGLPWLGVFSWGEQGHVTGIGNLHGNEMASTLLFPAGN
ncbi:MAG: FIST N-terminal domain-containing protein [Kofleriaceae bacterium]